MIGLRKLRQMFTLLPNVYAVRSGKYFLKNYLKIINSILLFHINCSLGTNDEKNIRNINLKLTEKRNEKCGSISYAAQTPNYSPIPEQPSAPGVCLCSS